MNIFKRFQRTLGNWRGVKALTSAAVAASLAVLALSAPTPALAEGQIRVAEQVGIVYLMLNVVREQKLVEKHGRQDVKGVASLGNFRYYLVTNNPAFGIEACSASVVRA